MLSCELCCSFRAVRLLCLILLQQSSLKKPFFFSNALSWGVRALTMSICYVAALFFPQGCPAQQGGSLVTACRGFAEVFRGFVGSALMLALPCCCVYFPVVLFIWVLLELPWQCWPASVMADPLCYGGLPWQWQAASAMADYLLRGGVPW